MFQRHDQLEKNEIQPGVLLQQLGRAVNINAVHWDFEDGRVVALHEHTQEQFGYIIKGQLKVTIGDETAVLGAGDCYFVPANTPHMFISIGETEAIDVFTPPRNVG
jgi:quercetin dioxygenase-like cupin family protein